MSTSSSKWPEKSPGMPVVLTIAGSDSGGGAGIQADLKVFSTLNVFGTTAITCVTAQNPEEVTAIYPIDPDIVMRQIKAVSDSFPLRAAKTGMLYSAEIIRMVAMEDIREGIPILVVDPVMVAASGARLLQANAIDALCNELLPKARVVTPNLHESEILCGHSISSVEELRVAAREIGDRYDVACIVKGGHINGEEIVDVLYDEGDEYIFRGRRIYAEETHGAGCAFSSALTAYLAKGEIMAEATRKAKEFVANALVNALKVGRHSPLNLMSQEGVPTS